MPTGDLDALILLNRLRDAVPNGIRLHSLLRGRESTRSLRDLQDTVERLVAVHYVEAFEEGNPISVNALSSKLTKLCLECGSRPNRAPESPVVIRLGVAFAIAQKALGLSLSEMITTSSDGIVAIHPLFGLPKGKPSTDVFVLMPFSTELKPIFEDHIKQVCNTLGLTVARADDLFSSTAIMQDVWEFIYNSQLIIADCTGRNPNVYYELGIAHTLGKQFILLTQSSDDIPADIRHLRHIKYEYTPRGMTLFQTLLKKSIEESHVIGTAAPARKESGTA